MVEKPHFAKYKTEIIRNTDNIELQHISITKYRCNK